MKFVLKIDINRKSTSSFFAKFIQYHTVQFVSTIYFLPSLLHIKIYTSSIFQVINI